MQGEDLDKCFLLRVLGRQRTLLDIIWFNSDVRLYRKPRSRLRHQAIYITRGRSSIKSILMVKVFVLGIICLSVSSLGCFSLDSPVAVIHILASCTHRHDRLSSRVINGLYFCLLTYQQSIVRRLSRCCCFFVDYACVLRSRFDPAICSLLVQFLGWEETLCKRAHAAADCIASAMP